MLRAKVGKKEVHNQVSFVQRITICYRMYSRFIHNTNKEGIFLVDEAALSMVLAKEKESNRKCEWADRNKILTSVKRRETGE